MSVVIPAYNEAALIMDSLITVYGYLETISDRYDWEIVVVDDGSTDETGAIADLFAARRPRARVLHHAVNFNLGQALRFAFATCRGDYVVTLDSDLTYAPEHIGVLLESLREKRARVALASPYMKGGHTSGIPIVRRGLSRAANRFLSLTAEGHLSTLTGMVRAYDRVFLASLDLRSRGPEINAEILYKAQVLGARVIEVPAHLDWRAVREREPRRRSRIRLRRATASYLFSGFMFRPVVFFLLPGVFLFGIALWTLGFVALQTFQEYGRLSGSFDPRFTAALAATFASSPHSYIVGGVTLLLSVQLISTGVLASQSRRYFEELFHLGTTLLRRHDRI